MEYLTDLLGEAGDRIASLPFTAWANFYVLVGTAAATLAGLMFVVITLMSGTRRRIADMGIAAFSTPAIVHFCAALAVAAILSAPWQALWHAALLLGCTGFGGLAYNAVVVRRIRRVEYSPVLEDYLWHVAFPLVSYVALVVAAVLLPGKPTPALFLVGAATVLLVFIGIHNAPALSMARWRAGTAWSERSCGAGSPPLLGSPGY